MDMVWATWSAFSEAWAGTNLPDLFRSVDQCIRMSDAALRYGCDIDSSIAFNRHLPSALVFLFCYDSEIPSQDLETAFQYLCNVGYDIEGRDFSGATLLLIQATEIFRSVVSMLKFLIEKGADLHAVDSENCGALHLAFEVPEGWGAWNSSCTGGCNHSYYIFDHEFYARNYFNTESEEYAEDYDDDDLTPAPFIIDEDDEEYEKDDENDTEALELPEGYVLYRDDDNGSEEMFRKPLPILKTRLRFKLLTLLRAGCDPNLLNNQGCSPSDDARYHGLWPEWTWALLNAEYVFDEDSNHWVKRVEDEVTSGS